MTPPPSLTDGLVLLQCSDGMDGNGSCACEPNFSSARCHFCSAPNKFGPRCDRSECPPGGAALLSHHLRPSAPPPPPTACPCIHGRCDNRPDSDGSCRIGSCSSGFTGTFCQRRSAPCGPLARYCHAHAHCDLSQGAAR